ncbi:MAG: hypothetical protein JSR63_07825 [Proteobacteria bacterium]|nr:hypothetical protein [Pseudomonadota bacterium]
MAANLTIGGKGSLRTEFDLQGALAVSRNLGILASSLPLMQKMAISTLRRRLPVEARRDIQREYNVPAAKVRALLRAIETNSGLKLVGDFKGGRFGLINFNAKDLSPNGVSAKIYKGGVTSIRPHAFFATLGSGNVHIVERRGPKVAPTQGRYAGKVSSRTGQPILRQKMKTAYGPTVAQMLRKGDRPQRLADYAGQVLQKEIARLIEVWAGGKPIPGADNGSTGDSDT